MDCDSDSSASESENEPDSKRIKVSKGKLNPTTEIQNEKIDFEREIIENTNAFSSANAWINYVNLGPYVETLKNHGFNSLFSLRLLNDAIIENTLLIDKTGFKFRLLEKLKILKSIPEERLFELVNTGKSWVEFNKQRFVNLSTFLKSFECQVIEPILHGEGYYELQDLFRLLYANSPEQSLNMMNLKIDKEASKLLLLEGFRQLKKHMQDSNQVSTVSKNAPVVEKSCQPSKNEKKY